MRVHEEGLAGHVLGKGNWVHLKLPLEYETKPPRGTSTNPADEQGRNNSVDPDEDK
jgi:hypothetical protein